MENYIQKHKDSQMMQVCMKNDMTDIDLEREGELLNEKEREYIRELAYREESKGEHRIANVLLRFIEGDLQEQDLKREGGLIDMHQREYLKILACDNAFVDTPRVSLVLKDFCHRIRYNEEYRNKPYKDFGDYIERKYGQEVENINKLRTY